MRTVSEEPSFEMEEDEDEEEGRCAEGSRSYQHILSLPTFTPQDWDRLLADVQKHAPRHFALTFIMIRTRLPLVAVLGQQLGDYDRRGSVLRVVRGWGEQGVFPIPNRSHPFHPHGDLGHLVVTLSSDILQVVHDQITALEQDGRPCDPTAWLFPGRDNQPWKYRYITNFTLRPALKRCHLPELFPKDLYYCLLKSQIKEQLHAKS